MICYDNLPGLALAMSIPSISARGRVRGARLPQGINTKNKKDNSKTLHIRSTVYVMAAPTSPLYKKVWRAFLKANGEKFTNYPKEARALHRLIDKARAREPVHFEDLLISVCRAFKRLKESDTSSRGFWRGTPFLPSALASDGIWDRVLETMRNDEVPEWMRKMIAGEKHDTD